MELKPNSPKWEYYCPKCHQIWDHYPSTYDCGNGHFDEYRGRRCYGIADKREIVNEQDKS